MNDPARLEAFTQLLQRDYQCRAVLLYGSRARGDATDDSDWDMMGIRAAGDTVHDARVIDGAYFDGFVYGEEALVTLDREMLRVRGGRVLCEHEGQGAALLARLDAMYAAGPPALTSHERSLMHSWPRKMLARLRAGDLEGDFRRVMLLNELPETYFALRGQWYEGSKHAFAWLATHAPEAHTAFARALRPGAPVEHIAALVDVVLAV